MKIPADYPMSKDIIDRRKGQKPTLGEKIRDLSIKVMDDFKGDTPGGAMAAKTTSKPLTKKIDGKSYPAFKNGGKVKKTGLIYAHKGETVIPASKRCCRKKA